MKEIKTVVASTKEERKNLFNSIMENIKPLEVDENGKVLGMFAPTGNIPSFFHDFKAKGVPVDESVFLKGAVKLDENGEPVLPNTPPPPPGA